MFLSFAGDLRADESFRPRLLRQIRAVMAMIIAVSGWEKKNMAKTPCLSKPSN